MTNRIEIDMKTARVLSSTLVRFLVPLANGDVFDFHVQVERCPPRPDVGDVQESTREAIALLRTEEPTGAHFPVVVKLAVEFLERLLLIRNAAKCIDKYEPEGDGYLDASFFGYSWVKPEKKEG